MQTVLITGGAGFIGSHLCERLLQEGYTLICVDNFLTGSEENITHLRSNPAFTFIYHDIIQPLEIDTHIDAIFHLASPASPNHHSKISYHALPMETMLANSQGTRELLQLAENHHARFLYASTSEVYGDPMEHPQKESYRGNVSTIGPRSIYDEAKRFGETITAYFWRERQVDARIARIFNTFGPRMRKDDMRMISIFIQQALKGDPITIFGDGTQTRSLTYIDDTIEGLIRLLFRPGTAREVVNIGSPNEYTVREYAELVKKLTNSSSEIVRSEQLPTDDPIRRKPDVTKAKEILDWEPKIDLEEGVKRIIEYFKQV